MSFLQALTYATTITILLLGTIFSILLWRLPVFKDTPKNKIVNSPDDDEEDYDDDEEEDNVIRYH